MLLEVGIGLGEVAAAEESSVGGEGRGMRGGKHEVFRLVDEGPLGNGVAAPEEEYKACSLCRQGLNGSIGECLPSVTLVAASLVGADSEGGIKEQYPLDGPFT